MKIYHGERCSGKTTKLICKSAETGAVIVTNTMRGADFVRDTAKRLGVDIPRPISYEVLLRKVADHKPDPNGYLIDELQWFLDKHLHVNAATVNCDCLYKIDQEETKEYKEQWLKRSK